MGKTGLKGGQDRRLGIVAHGNDEGKAVPGYIGAVHLLELGPLGVGQGIQARAGLFAAALTDTYTDVTLLRHEVVSSDITDSAKAPQAAVKLPAEDAQELVPPLEDATTKKGK